MSHRSRLARHFERAEMRRQQPAAMGFSADPTPRPTMGPESLVPYLLSQGVLPSWAIGPGPEGSVGFGVRLGPIAIPLLLTPAQAREASAKLVEAAEQAEAQAAQPDRCPGAGGELAEHTAVLLMGPRRSCPRCRQEAAAAPTPTEDTIPAGFRLALA